MSLRSVPKQDMLLFKHIPLPRGKIRNKKLSAKPHEMLGVNLQKTNISHKGKSNTYSWVHATETADNALVKWTTTFITSLYLPFTELFKTSYKGKLGSVANVYIYIYV